MKKYILINTVIKKWFNLLPTRSTKGSLKNEPYFFALRQKMVQEMRIEPHGLRPFEPVLLRPKELNLPSCTNFCSAQTNEAKAGVKHCAIFRVRPKNRK